MIDAERWYRRSRCLASVPKHPRRHVHAAFEMVSIASGSFVSGRWRGLQISLSMTSIVASQFIDARSQVSKMTRRLSENATAVHTLPETLIERGRGAPDFGLSSATSRERTERLLSDASGARELLHRLVLSDIELKHRLTQHRSHFNPQQPRVPAGSPEGGQWTSTGGSGMRLAAADRPRFGLHAFSVIAGRAGQARDRGLSFRKWPVGFVWA